MKPKVCISYSHTDEEKYFKNFKKRLALLERNEVIEFWADHKIIAGQNWDQTIKDKFSEGDIFILLVSDDFTYSDYIDKVEKKIMLQSKDRGAKIIPVFVRECNLKYHPWITKNQGLNTRDNWIGNSKPNEVDSLYKSIFDALDDHISEYIESKAEASLLHLGISKIHVNMMERARVLESLQQVRDENPLWNFIPSMDKSIEDGLFTKNETEFKEATSPILLRSQFIVLICEEFDNFSQWQWDLIKERWLQNNDFCCLIFFNENDNHSQKKDSFYSDIKMFTDDQKSENLMLFSFGGYQSVIDAIEQLFEKHFVLPDREGDDEIDGTMKSVTIGWEPNRDGQKVVDLEIIDTLSEKLDVANLFEVSSTQDTLELLNDSDGIALYIADAEYKWFNTIQVYLKKYFKNEQKIGPRLAIIDEPRKAVLQTIMDKKIFDPVKGQVSEVENKDQVKQRLEEFVTEILAD